MAVEGLEPCNVTCMALDLNLARRPEVWLCQCVRVSSMPKDLCEVHDPACCLAINAECGAESVRRTGTFHATAIFVRDPPYSVDQQREIRRLLLNQWFSLG